MAEPTSETFLGRQKLNIDTTGWGVASPETPTPTPKPNEGAEAKTPAKEEPKPETKKQEEPKIVSFNKPEDKKEIELTEEEKIFVDMMEEEKEAKEAKEAKNKEKEEKEEATNNILDSIRSNPFKAKIFAALESDDMDALEKIVTETMPTNWDKKTDENIYSEFLKAQGIEGDDYEADMDGFRSKLKGEQRAIASPLRNEFKKLEGQKPVQRPDLSKQREETILQKGRERLDETMDKILKEGKYKFVQITPEMAERIKLEALHDERPPAKFDRSGNLVEIDVPTLINRHFLQNYEKQYVKAINEISKRETVIKFFNERHRPNLNHSDNGSIPLVEPNVGDDMKEITEKRWGAGQRKIN